MSRQSSDEISIGSILIVGAIVLILVGGAFWLLPRYGVYRNQLAGQAKLKEAESSRQIRVLEAKAKAESARLEAEAEVERAKGVAEANKIIGDSLKNSPEYLQYLYITGLQEKDGVQGDRTVIYDPTQNGMPVLPTPEAGRAVK